ncbi:energy transducer TonB [Flavobacterium sp. SUN046]|uniref:energy transducer TonB n=1 Tax=Flavobacterium sp. SUN046 TaxID=3002440 RepID=UPI002DB8CC16|nr:energy transducer TonB [Flavobacterium sp. SUN046]MEC4049256.1 energy transducer TonB [Flavobacterium sp. SUN046]
MKLDLLKKQWLDIVFEGRNKSYGAYQLRKDNSKVNVIALGIGAFVFALAVATPLLIDMLPSKTDGDESLNEKITTVKLPPKKVEEIKNLPPPPPPPPKVDQIKFVKPVVAKTEDVHEDPPKMDDLKEKNISDKTQKGDPTAIEPIGPVGDGPKGNIVEEDTNLYNSAGVEVKPEFPGGIDKFYKFISNNFDKGIIEDENFPGGRIMVSFTVEKDGSLSDIKTRDIGYGTGKEAERLLRKCPRWAPAEQNGKKVRCSYVLPIVLAKGGE